MDKRYLLHRELLAGKGSLLWVMLNPSTADDQTDDPTIKKCFGFTAMGGFQRFEVVNLFAARATKTPELHRLVQQNKAEAVGEFNDGFIRNAAQRSSRIVVAWGANRTHGRADEVCEILARYDLYCLGTTKDGHPRHPLYVPYSTTPTLWRDACTT